MKYSFTNIINHESQFLTKKNLKCDMTSINLEKNLQYLKI